MFVWAHIACTVWLRLKEKHIILISFG